VPIDASHPAREKPSWHGNSVGHWDGNTLVIDTIGVKTDRPYAMIDLFGTPYTKDLHVDAHKNVGRVEDDMVIE
jgi:hypothetical protein